LDLGGIRFKVEAYNKHIHDQKGHPLVPFWIRIKGLPYRLFKPEEQRRLADDLGGGILLDVDPRSGYHLDFTYFRMKIGVCDRDVILKYCKLKFDENGDISFHTLTIEVEDIVNQFHEDLNGPGPDQGNKKKSLWQSKEKGSDGPSQEGLSQDSQ
jgi:hypothetical protein